MGHQDPLRWLLHTRRAPRRIPSRGGTQSDLRFHRTPLAASGKRTAEAGAKAGRTGEVQSAQSSAAHARPLLCSLPGSPLPLERARAQSGVQGSRYAGWPPASSPPLSPSVSLDMCPSLFSELCLLLLRWSIGQEHSSCPSFVRQLMDGSHQLPLTLSWGSGRQEGERKSSSQGAGWAGGHRPYLPPPHIHPRPLPAKSRIGR